MVFSFLFFLSKRDLHVPLGWCVLTEICFIVNNFYPLYAFGFLTLFFSFSPFLSYFSAQIYNFGLFPNAIPRSKRSCYTFCAAASGATHALNFVVDFERFFEVGKVQDEYAKRIWCVACAKKNKTRFCGVRSHVSRLEGFLRKIEWSLSRCMPDFEFEKNKLKIFYRFSGWNSKITDTFWRAKKRPFWLFSLIWNGCYYLPNQWWK